MFMIVACHQSERRTVHAESPAAAIDIIDDCAAAGFIIEMVVDQHGVQIEPMSILHQLLEEEDRRLAHGL